MDKEKAKETLLAYACCSFSSTKNKLCEKCPWYEKNECSINVFNEETIVEAVNVLE